MKERFFRCLWCSTTDGEDYDFLAEMPLCPRCGHSGEPVVLELTLVHFLVPDVQGPMLMTNGRRWRLACQPGRRSLTEAGITVPASDQPQVVNCPNCRKTKAHEEAMSKWGIPPGAGSLKITKGCC